LDVIARLDNAFWEEIVTHERSRCGRIGHHRRRECADHPPWEVGNRGPREPKAGRDARMAAMKPRTGDGPLEVTKEGRGIVMRVPLEGGGRLVVEISADEAKALGEALKNVVG